MLLVLGDGEVEDGVEVLAGNGNERDRHRLSVVRQCGEPAMMSSWPS
jgi:hypothetical protein